MVSGFVTSPLDQERICLEDARPISMASKLLMSITGVPLLLVGGVAVGNHFDGVLDVLRVRRGGVVGHADLALFHDLFLLLVGGLAGVARRLVGRGAIAGAHAA